MNLSEFPHRIATGQLLKLENEQKLRKAVAELDRQTAEIEKAIAFSESLKNDAQRKAAKAEMMEAAEYRAALTAVQDIKDDLVMIEIDLGRTCNQFTVAKLEARLEIARSPRD